jgi:hypothetical protein
MVMRCLVDTLQIFSSCRSFPTALLGYNLGGEVVQKYADASEVADGLLK